MSTLLLRETEFVRARLPFGGVTSACKTRNVPTESPTGICQLTFRAPDAGTRRIVTTRRTPSTTRIRAMRSRVVTGTPG